MIFEFKQPVGQEDQSHGNHFRRQYRCVGVVCLQHRTRWMSRSLSAIVVWLHQPAPIHPRRFVQYRCQSSICTDVEQNHNFISGPHDFQRSLRKCNPVAHATNITYLLWCEPFGKMSRSSSMTWASRSPGKAAAHTMSTANATRNFIFEKLAFWLFDVNETISKYDLMLIVEKRGLFIRKINWTLLTHILRICVPNVLIYARTDLLLFFWIFFFFSLMSRRFIDSRSHFCIWRFSNADEFNAYPRNSYAHIHNRAHWIFFSMCQAKQKCNKYHKIPVSDGFWIILL